MSFNGSGQFLINSPGNPVVTGTTISTTWANDLSGDLATGLSTCITKDGQTTPIANIPMGGNKITNLANGTVSTDAATYGQLTVDGVPGYTTTATAAGITSLTSISTFYQFFTGITTQTVTLPDVTSLVLGFSFRIVNNSTGVVTVQSSGGNTIIAMPAGSEGIFTCILLTGTGIASWDFKYLGTAFGPASSTDGNIAVFNGTSGNFLKDSGSSIASLAVVPSGAILDFGGTSAPTGYLACDGTSYLRSDYPNLFTAIGTTWGSADGTHFNVPDFRRRTSVGSGGSGSGTLGNAVGNTGGSETNTIAQANLPNVNFTVTDPGHTHTQRGSGSGASAGLVAGDGNGTSNLNATASATTGITVESGGSGTAVNNIQPSAIVLKIIKT